MMAQGQGLPESLAGLLVVERGAVVVVKVKGVVVRIPGHSSVLLIIVPLSPQVAVRQAPRPSVVL
jgi:hypothetical protein